MAAPRPDHFTDEVRTVLSRAAQLVKDHGGRAINPEHLLLALLEEGRGAALRVLTAQNANVDALKAALLRIVSQGAKPATRHPSVSQTADQVLRVALAEARRFGSGFVGTEQVLVGLLAVRDGYACGLLEEAGATLDAARNYARTRALPQPEAPARSGREGRARRAEPEGARAETRIGIGYDVHEVVTGGRLVLGGVEIPGSIGLAGHSDADVLCHAISDALLGAAALGDIGQLFPDTDPAYAGASSLSLLAEVLQQLARDGWQPHNVDAVVIAQQPKIAPYVPRMRETLAGTLGVDLGCVAVKGTTTEGLGFEGDGLGIAAQAVALIVAG